MGWSPVGATTVACGSDVSREPGYQPTVNAGGQPFHFVYPKGATGKHRDGTIR